MKLKIDSCSLINLQHIDLIPLISKTIGELIITDEVFKESIEIGLMKKKSIAEDLQNHYQNGIIKKIKNRGLIPTNLDLGEAETIAETYYEMNQNEDVICITEDKKAKREAIKLKINVLGVDSLLVELYLANAINEDDFNEKIILLDKYHKLDLIRITELRRFVYYMKNMKKEKK